MTRMTNRTVIVCTALLLACGGSDDPKPGGPSMGALDPQLTTTLAGRNSAPEIVSISFRPGEPAAGEPVRAVVKTSDAEGDGVRLGYRWSLNGEHLSGGGDLIEPGRQARKGDSLSVRVTPSDGMSEGASATHSVRLGNRAPTLSGVTLQPSQGLTAGSEVVAIPSVRDLDGDTIEFAYHWRVNGRSVSESGPTLSTEGLRRGDTVEVEVVASDGEARSGSARHEPVRLVNAEPVVTKGASTSDASGVFRTRILAEDPDGDRTLRFRLVRGPSGMTISSTQGEIEWAPSDQQPGSHSVEVEVDDLHGGVVKVSFEVTVETTSSPASP